jgi:hypothetical protein
LISGRGAFFDDPQTIDSLPKSLGWDGASSTIGLPEIYPGRMTPSISFQLGEKIPLFVWVYFTLADSRLSRNRHQKAPITFGADGEEDR